MVKMPRKVMRYSPSAGKHTEHTVERVKKRRASELKWGQRRFRKATSGYRGFPRPKPSGEKPTKRVNLLYRCSETGKAHQPAAQRAKKINIYNQMAQVLMGHSVSGTILRFSRDGKVIGGSVNMKECIFMNFSRLLAKDEIKKGSFTLKLGVNPHYDKPFRNSIIKVQDTNAENDYRVNSPAGEYGILYMTNDVGTAGVNTTNTIDDRRQAGLLFYQAGIAVLTSSLFQVFDSTAALGSSDASDGMLSASVYMSNGSSSAFIDTGKNNTLNTSINGILTGSAISGACSEIRHRIFDVSFNNTTELNSSIYFCRVNHNDFNYSSNPTYLNSSKIRVKNTSTDAPVAYITGVGLYSPDNELMAVAKLSEPLKKDPTNELTLRVRLDY